MPKKKVTKLAKKAKPTYAQGLRALADSWEANVKALDAFKCREDLYAWWENEGISEGHDAETDEDAFNGWLAMASVTEDDNGYLFVELEYGNLVYVENLWMYEDEAEIPLGE